MMRFCFWGTLWGTFLMVLVINNQKDLRKFAYMVVPV